MPFDWTINPYRGCTHACVYCFARSTHTYLDMDAGRDFETKIVVKVNAPDVLRRELAAPRWNGEPSRWGRRPIRTSGRRPVRLMPRIIQVLTERRNPFSILTKGTLILRDLDLLVRAREVAEVSTAFSIGTLDEDAWRRTEPGTPHPRARLEAVAALNDAGVPCSVLVTPILPGITDAPAQVREVVAAAIEAGATQISPILLHLRPGIREQYLPWLEEHYPSWSRGIGSSPGVVRTAVGSQRAGSRVASIVRSLGGLRPRGPAAEPARFRRWQQPRSVPAKEKPTQLRMLDRPRRRDTTGCLSRWQRQPGTYHVTSGRPARLRSRNLAHGRVLAGRGPSLTTDASLAASRSLAGSG